MGLMKKLMKSLSLKDSSSKKSGRIRSSRDYGSEYLNSSNLAAATTGNGSMQGPLDSRTSHASNFDPRGSRPDVRLEHTRPTSNSLAGDSSSFEESKGPNIQERKQSSEKAQATQAGKEEHIFVRPQLEQTFAPDARSNPLLHSQASVLATGEQSPGTVALTIILDASLSASKHIKDIALGILNLLRLLSAEDTISIFGCDGASSGLFTFPAETANYPQIMDLVCNMHKKFVGRQPKLNEAIVMVVEELNDLDQSFLKPLIIMSDYQEKDEMGPPFEAQHALLWSTTQNLHPIFVSVWDQDLFSGIRTRTSKEVHIESLSNSEINAAVLVIQSQIKIMMRRHQERAPFSKSHQMLSQETKASALPSTSSRGDFHKERDPLGQDQGSLVSIPTLPQSLPPIDELAVEHDTAAEQRENVLQRASREDRNDSAPSIASEVGLTDSVIDSTANCASSGGNGEREALSSADFPNVPTEEKYIGGPEWEIPKEVAKEPQEFEGFPTTSNALFMDSGESDDGYAECPMDDVIKSKTLLQGSKLPPLQADRSF